MLRAALNFLTGLHSRVGTLKRYGSPDIFSPCRITPSNYFRNLRGPEYTTIKGSEFIIPVDTMLGHYSQRLSFNEVPESGTFKLKFGSNTTDFLQFDSTADDIQTELRLIVALANVVVTGDFSVGFSIVFEGFENFPALGQVLNNTLVGAADPVTEAWAQTTTPWIDLIKKGDVIIDGNKQYTIDEIIEMHDLGAIVMGYRVRAD